MFADVGQKHPTKRSFRLRIGPSRTGRCCGLRIDRVRYAGDLTSFSTILLQKQNVSPGRGAEPAGVVIGIARPDKTVVGNLVPLFASDFTRLAPNTKTRIGEKADRRTILHIGVPALVRAVNAFTNHTESEVMERPDDGVME